MIYAFLRKEFPKFEQLYKRLCTMHHHANIFYALRMRNQLMHKAYFLDHGS